MKNNFKILIAVLFASSFSFSSCDKDVTDIEIEQDEPVISELIDNNPLVIDSKKQEWHFSLKPRKLTKGMLVNEAEYYESIIIPLRKVYGDDYKLIDTINFTYKNRNYDIKVLRVDRKSEPGKFFYVMIDNLDVRLDTACWAYGDNESNVKKYGRLYTWDAANALANEIPMRLPVYDANNPMQKKFGGALKMSVKAKLLSRQDILDIIECEAIGDLTKNGYTLDDLNEQCWNNIHADAGPLFYYDVFVGGLECSNVDGRDYAQGEHTLGGMRNTYRQPQWAWSDWNGDGWYKGLNEFSKIWTSEGYADIHYPLQIERKYKENLYEYSAFINSMLHSNEFGYSVRYVFEPLYK